MFFTWRRLELAFVGYRRRGIRLVSPAEGTSALALVRFNSLHRACAWTDIRTLHTVRTTTTTTTTGSNRFVFPCCCDQVVEPGGRHDAAWRPRLRVAEKAATPALIVATLAAERRNGPVRSRPPQLRQGGGWCKVRQPTGTEEGQGRGGCEYGDRSPEQPGTLCSSSCLTKKPRGCGPGFSPSLGRRNGSSGTPWSTLSTLSAVRPWCRSSTLLCRRRWNSCQTCPSSSTRSRPIPSRLSKCPRSYLRTSLCARFCATRSW